MPSFLHDGHRIAYTVHGADAAPAHRTVVLIHGLLFNQKLQAPLGRALARRGNRVVTIDLLGHGASDRPTAMQEYSMTAFGEQVIGLLDHLELDQAVVGGLSLGANATLEACALAPERIRGMIIEMPVLDGALIGCAVAFTPLMVALTSGAPLMRGLSRVMRRVPTPVWFADVMADWLRQDPEASAAVMQGLFFARVAPPKSVRQTLTPPTIVIGHPSDPVHPWSDSDELVRELPNARLVRASSILEGRLRPQRLSGEIAEFVDACFLAAKKTAAEPSGRAA
jgi:pimeloyl-ACP methyl ester carboxylesterase